MRRTAALLAGLIVLLSLVTPVGAGPRAIPQPQATLAAITSPKPFEALRGNVSISGTAQHSQFQRYELYYKLEPSEDWVFIGDAHFQPVNRGALGTWPTQSLPDGTYSLRLRVVRLDGNYDEAVVRQVLVANAQPTETSTPEVSPTPTDTPTPVPPTPTVVIEAPLISTATPEPTETPAPDDAEETAAGSAAEEDGGLFGMNRWLSQIDVPGLGDAFILGLRYTLYAFGALAAYLVLKRVVSWIWALIRADPSKADNSAAEIHPSSRSRPSKIGATAAVDPSPRPCRPSLFSESPACAAAWQESKQRQ